jgi:AAA+ ATPase superfamily predicted ATPase
MKNRIVGRYAEIARLDRCMDSSTAQLVVVYGRIRVGKTFLINEYFDNSFAFKITGAYKKSKRFQLESFNEELMRKSGKDWDIPTDWRSAFRRLREYRESLPEIGNGCADHSNSITAFRLI